MPDLSSPLIVDLDTGGGTERASGVNLRISGSGGSIEAKGQQTMANSLPVVIASDQAAIDVSGATVTVDSELAAAAALADDFANPTTAPVGAFGMLWDGATWDRMKGDSTDGVLVNLGANNDVSITGSVDTELPAAAALSDDAANPTTPLVGACLLGFDGTTWDRIYTVADGDAVAAATKGFLLLGSDGSNYQVLKTAADGTLETTSSTPTNPTNDYVTSASLAAGGTANLDSPERAGKKLTGVEVWATISFKSFVHTVDNGVESTSPVAVGGGKAYDTWKWEPPHRYYVELGTTAGADTFRVKVTNLDDNAAADVYTTIHSED